MRRLLGGGLLVFALPALAGAQAPPAGAPAPPPGGAADARRTVHQLPASVARAFAGTFSRKNLRPALFGGAGIAAAFLLDDPVVDNLTDPENRIGLWFERSGQPSYSAITVWSAFIASRFVDAPRIRATAYDLAVAHSVNWAYTTIVKSAVRRTRPNGEDNRSFPSGHASNAVTLATVVSQHYGPKLGIPAYALAGAVVLSRTQRNKHYLSDVVAGAALGYVVGRTVVRTNGGPSDPGTRRQIAIEPVIGPGVRALMMSMVF